ncbi:MAG: hypothetical protein ACI8PB_003827 [Desulforhopalus sp.]|jgi:hypothetical protein
MELEIYSNLLWLIPLVVWFLTRNESPILRSTAIGVSFGLVVTHASFGLHALHLAWPISEEFGQLGFYSSYIHVKAGIKVAIILNLVSDHTPITDDKKLLIEIVNSISWAITYGALGLLWGYFRHRWNEKFGNTDKKV